MNDTLAVIGAGQMGSGIAQVSSCFVKNHVVVYDSSENACERAKAAIEKSVGKLHSKGKLEEGTESILSRITFSSDLDSVKDCSFVIEAIVESESIKCELFKNLSEITQPHAILATNTSSIPIAKLGSATKCPENVIGMHFMNPVPIMSLVEIIRSPLTSDQTYDKTKSLAEAMGKETVCSKDFPGFIVNRILMPMINEAFFALQDGLATAKDIDQAMVLGTNQPMGPLALADFIGLDTCLSILEVMLDDFGDPKYRPSALLRQYVQAGLLGRKTGRGVYEY